MFISFCDFPIFRHCRKRHDQGWTGKYPVLSSCDHVSLKTYDSSIFIEYEPWSYDNIAENRIGN